MLRTRVYLSDGTSVDLWNPADDFATLLRDKLGEDAESTFREFLADKYDDGYSDGYEDGLNEDSEVC